MANQGLCIGGSLDGQIKSSRSDTIVCYELKSLVRQYKDDTEIASETYSLLTVGTQSFWISNTIDSIITDAASLLSYLAGYYEAHVSNGKKI